MKLLENKIYSQKTGIVLIRENGQIIAIKPAQKYGDLIHDEIKL